MVQKRLDIALTADNQTHLLYPGIGEEITFEHLLVTCSDTGGVVNIGTRDKDSSRFPIWSEKAISANGTLSDYVGSLSPGETLVGGVTGASNAKLLIDFDVTNSNIDYGLIVGGVNQRGFIPEQTNQFKYATNTFSDRFVLAPINRRRMAGAGNKRTAVFSGGQREDGAVNPGTLNFDYFTEAFTTSASSSTSLFSLAGAANNVTAVFAGGTAGATNATTVSKYDFASSTWTNNASGLSQGNANQCAASVSDKAFFFKGDDSNTSYKFVYATSTMINSIPRLSAPARSSSAINNRNVIAVMGGANADGAVKDIDLFEIPTETVGSSFLATIARHQGVGLSEKTRGTAIAGVVGTFMVGTYEQYDFATRATTGGLTPVSGQKNIGAGVSTNPGGLAF